MMEIRHFYQLFLANTWWAEIANGVHILLKNPNFCGAYIYRNGLNYRNGLLLFVLPAQFLVILIEYTCTD